MPLLFFISNYYNYNYNLQNCFKIVPLKKSNFATYMFLRFAGRGFLRTTSTTLKQTNKLQVLKSNNNGSQSTFVFSQRNSTNLIEKHRQQLINKRKHSSHKHLSHNQDHSTNTEMSGSIAIKKPFERLSPHVKPSHYDLNLTVDIEHFSFT